MVVVLFGLLWVIIVMWFIWVMEQISVVVIIKFRVGCSSGSVILKKICVWVVFFISVVFCVEVGMFCSLVRKNSMQQLVNFYMLISVRVSSVLLLCFSQLLFIGLNSFVRQWLSRLRLGIKINSYSVVVLIIGIIIGKKKVVCSQWLM